LCVDRARRARRAEDRPRAGVAAVTGAAITGICIAVARIAAVCVVAVPRVWTARVVDSARIGIVDGAAVSRIRGHASRGAAHEALRRDSENSEDTRYRRQLSRCALHFIRPDPSKRLERESGQLTFSSETGKRLAPAPTLS